MRLALLGGLLGSVGCGLFIKTTKVASIPLPPLHSEPLDSLVSDFNRNANSIQTFYAKMELVPSWGGPRVGKRKTTNVSIDAYLQISRPANIRLSGSEPLEGTLFDMASNGDRFELYIPPKNRFYVGQNDVIPAHVDNPLEKMRPQVILNSMLFNPIDRATQVVSEMNGDPETSTDYQILVASPPQNGLSTMMRRIFISRVNLLPRRQQIFDANGFVATDVTYSDYHTVRDIPVAYHITINRPSDEYSLALKMTQVILNQPMAADIFVLTQPAGSVLVNLDQAAASTNH